MREYEFTFVVRSDVEEQDMMAVVERAKSLITDNNGEVLKLDLWGTRRLAYPIGESRDGQYVFMHIKLPPQALIEAERGLNLMEPVIRHLFVRLDD